MPSETTKGSGEQTQAGQEDEALGGLEAASRQLDADVDEPAPDGLAVNERWQDRDAGVAAGTSHFVETRLREQVMTTMSPPTDRGPMAATPVGEDVTAGANDKARSSNAGGRE